MKLKNLCEILTIPILILLGVFLILFYPDFVDQLLEEHG